MAKISAENRQKGIKFIVDLLDAILPGNPDSARHKAYLEKLSDADLHRFALDLQSGKKYLTLTAPPAAKSSLNLERNFKIAEKIGHKFFHRLWISGQPGMPEHLTTAEYLVMKSPVRVASQRVAKKMSIPKTQKAINALTGQPTGESKGASISYPEVRYLSAMGMNDTLIELMKYRGGDLRGNAALNASLMQTGEASIEILKHFASGVESTKTVEAYLTSAMLKNNL